LTEEETITSNEGTPNPPDLEQPDLLLNEKINVRQAGRIASSSQLEKDERDPTNKEFGSPMEVTEDYLGPSGMVDTNVGGCVLYKDAKPKEVQNILMCKELLSVSPDSGTEMSTTVPAEGDQVEMEPMGVSSAREEVALLGVAKLRLESHHKRLDRKLKENEARITKVREVRKGEKELYGSGQNSYTYMCMYSGDSLKHLGTRGYSSKCT